MSRADHDGLVLPGMDRGPDGALVFAEPWNARAFALVVAMSERGQFTLKEFQAELIEAIGAHEKVGCIDSDGAYYTRWIEALTALVVSKGLADRVSVAAAEAAIVTGAAAIREHQHEASRRSNGTLRVEPVAIA